MRIFDNINIEAGALIFKGASSIKNNLSVLTIDVNNNFLYDTTGTNTTVDWENLWLFDSSGTQGMNWGTRQLYDYSGTASLNFGNALGSQRLLLDVAGNTAVDWNNRLLMQGSATTIADWNTVTNALAFPTGSLISSISGIGSVIDLTDGALVISTDFEAFMGPYMELTEVFGSQNVGLFTTGTDATGAGLFLGQSLSFGTSLNLYTNYSGTPGTTTNHGLQIYKSSTHYIMNLQVGSTGVGGFPTSDEINITTYNTNGVITITPGTIAGGGALILRNPLVFEDQSGGGEVLVDVHSLLSGSVTVKFPNKSGTFAYLTDAAVLLAKKTGVNFNTTADTSITLSNGTTFVITDILITNSSTNLTTADDGEWWTGASRTGSKLAHITTSGISTLVSSSNYVNKDPAGSGNVVFINASNVTNGTPIYFSLGTPQGAAATADMYVYGYILA